MSDPKETVEQAADRKQIVEELERWYFGGKTFREWEELTQVGDWRTILDEAVRRMVKLQAKATHQRDELDDWKQSAQAAALESCDDDRDHCTCVGPLRASNAKLRAELEEARELVFHIGMATPAQSWPGPIMARYTNLIAKHRQQAGEGGDG